MQRCAWCLKDELYTRYHDEEWGLPLHDDQLLFEFLILETMQAGLSWHTVLKKRENFREAYRDFRPEHVACFGESDVTRLLSNPGIIRNQAKIKASITNAQAFLTVKNEFGSFDEYIWGFVDGRPVINAFRNLSELPARTDLSDRISKDLKKRGFAFVGSTVVYAHMQATGMVNDHLVTCFRYHEVRQ
ncbi:MAG: DNA-3-methyladenine glycosylase I [Ignavibacteria bacterium]|nr:DNA-3-methyladenine glycosylase I [Ignavibacteria bacterium]